MYKHKTADTLSKTSFRKTFKRSTL